MRTKKTEPMPLIKKDRYQPRDSTAGDIKVANQRVRQAKKEKAVSLLATEGTCVHLKKCNRSRIKRTIDLQEDLYGMPQK